MRFIASRRWRLFLVCWLVYSVHFATNIEREHYPAFSLVDDASLQVDRYLGFHPDIFEHTDGHAYIGNNVAVSFLVAVPLLVFDPVLDALEARSRARLDRGESAFTEYRTYDRFPNKKRFFELAKAQGLELRFGGTAAVTTVFLMAPLSAAMVVLMFSAIVRRGVRESTAAWLALLFGLGTPLFFRSVSLNHNMFDMYAAFGAFYLLWARPDGGAPASLWRRAGAGALGGFCVAVDYSGIVILLCLYGYLLLSRMGAVGFRTAFVESLAFVAGSVPPVLFLMATQWAMFGNPFLPGQYWMPDVNYTDRGWRGFSMPTPDLILLNLFEPRWGLYTFGPLLLIALVPTFRYARESLILPRAERRFVAAFFVAFLLFCAANQYSRMQWNTGFRYLVPLLPFLFLAATDHLTRLPAGWKVAITVLAVGHSWVIAAMRQSVPLSYAVLLERGPELPWLQVLRMTVPPDTPIVTAWWLPLLILGATAVAAWGIWTWGDRMARRETPATVGGA